MTGIFAAERRKFLKSEVFIRYILGKYYNVTPEIALTDKGKPFAVNLPDLHFSLSHSGELIIMAVAERPVGADAEQVKQVDTDISKIWFTDSESRYLRSDGGINLHRFYEIWTRKESYSKMLGLGLLMDFCSFDIFSTDEARFKTFYAEDYVFSVCSDRNINFDKIIYEDRVKGAEFGDR